MMWFLHHADAIQAKITAAVAMYPRSAESGAELSRRWARSTMSAAAVSGVSGFRVLRQASFVMAKYIQSL
jgi:hypothetical protein